jgi:hypothetical protein
MSGAPPRRDHGASRTAEKGEQRCLLAIPSPLSYSSDGDPDGSTSDSEQEASGSDCDESISFGEAATNAFRSGARSHNDMLQWFQLNWQIERSSKITAGITVPESCYYLHPHEDDQDPKITESPHTAVKRVRKHGADESSQGAPEQASLNTSSSNNNDSDSSEECESITSGSSIESHEMRSSSPNKDCGSVSRDDPTRGSDASSPLKDCNAWNPVSLI